MRTRSKLAAIAALLGAGALAVIASAARRSGTGGDSAQVAYPPVDTPKMFADGIWVVDSGPISALGLELPVRMTVLRLQSGELLLHSPTRRTPALAEAIEALGPVRHLVAPSTGHWQFVEEWQRAHPDAQVWAVPGLRSRGQVRRSALRIDRDLGETAPGEWAQEVEQGIVKGGGGFSEAWFFHRPSRTLLLTDLVDNLESAKLPPLTSIAARLAGATGGTTPHHARAALLLRKAENKSALRHLVSLEPERVIFAHGTLFAEQGTQRLRRAFDWLI